MQSLNDINKIDSLIISRSEEIQKEMHDFIKSSIKFAQLQNSPVDYESLKITYLMLKIASLQEEIKKLKQTSESNQILDKYIKK